MSRDPLERTKKDQEIVALIQAGDREGIRMAYRQYGNILFGYIIKVVGSEQMAEEVLQDAFLKIWKNAKSFDPNKSRFFTWIVNIAKRSAIDKTRSAEFQQAKKTDSIDLVVSVKDSPTDQQPILDAGLQKVIEELPPKYRLLIELTFFKGYSQREIAKEFDIPLGTVKTRYRTAINELRTKLDKEQFLILLLHYFTMLKM